jgi:hypothetical protein
MSLLIKEVRELTASLKDDVVSIVSRGATLTSSTPPQHQQHIVTAGRTAVHVLEDARMAQAQRHHQNLLSIQNISARAAQVSHEMNSWANVARDATRIVECMAELQRAIEVTTQRLDAVLVLLPLLEQQLYARQTAHHEQLIREWKEKTVVETERERERLELQYKEKVRAALQAAFERQMAEYRADPGAFVAAPTAPSQSIDQVTLEDDAADQDALDRLFAEEQKRE